MRRVSIKTGLKQRLNEILGQADAPADELTPWSIQTAMLSNLQRIVKAIVGEDSGDGRKMKGLRLSANGTTNTYVNISAGIGFTSNGNVVVLESQIQYTVTGLSVAGEKYIYLKHVLQVVDADDPLNPEAKKTNFIDGSASENIVADDLCTSKKLQASSVINEIIVQHDGTPVSDPSAIYLGSVSVSGGTVQSAVDSYHIGFSY